MGTLAETGMWIVSDDVLTTGDEQKLVLLGAELGLDRPQAEAAFEVLSDASQALGRVRQAVATDASTDEDA